MCNIEMIDVRAVKEKKRLPMNTNAIKPVSGFSYLQC